MGIATREVARRAVEVEADAGGPPAATPASAKVPRRSLGPLQVHEDADRAAQLGLDCAGSRRHPRGAAPWLPWLKLS